MGIKCPKCQFENPDDTLYCGKCATSLKEDIPVSPTKTIESPKEELTTGSMFAERYQIIEELGKGGMGKQGRTAQAIRVILGAAGMKLKKRFNLELIEK